MGAEEAGEKGNKEEEKENKQQKRMMMMTIIRKWRTRRIKDLDEELVEIKRI